MREKDGKWARKSIKNTSTSYNNKDMSLGSLNKISFLFLFYKVNLPSVSQI